MVLLIFIFGVLLALGLFFIMADLLKLPRLGHPAGHALGGASGKEAGPQCEALLMGMAVKLARISTWMSTSGGG